MGPALVSEAAQPAANAAAKPTGEASPTGDAQAAGEAQVAGDAKPAKAKAPTPEDQPFDSYVPQLLMPALAKEIQSYGGPAPELSFEQGPMPVVGANCWMVKGTLPGERRFWLCFTGADINAAKTVAVAEAGSEPSLLESFLIDEKKMSLALLVSRLVQRLNGQKWLGPN
jgi:hypothetical protein